MSRYDEIIDLVSDSASPIIRYKALVNVQGAKEAGPEARKLRKQIGTSPIATGLLADLRASDPADRRGIFRVYETLKFLADIDYPAGDKKLAPYRDHVYAWLETKELEPLFIKEKYRLHGSVPGNAIYASVRLGLTTRKTRKICEKLLRSIWPGGGWNCSKLPATVGPTIVHTAYGMRGLVAYQSVTDTAEIRHAIESCAEILLERHVYLKRTNARPLRPVYTKLSYPYPRLYDFMAGLHILSRAGYVGDSRCEQALDLLESKFIEGQGWEMERKLFHHNESKDGFTSVHWEREKLGRANLFLTVDALEILQKAGRL